MLKTITSVLYAAILSLPLLLTACIDDHEQTAEEAPADILTRFSAEGKAWLTLNLSLPEGGGATRSVTFDDGSDQEHAVRTLTLVLFHGTGTEEQMLVASTYQLDYTAEPDGHAQVTHHSQQTLQISSDNIHANDRLAFLAFANVSPTITAGQSFAQVRNLTTDITTNISGTDYFVMSSSPLASANDGTGTVTTLIEINSSNLHPTEAEAQNNPAGHIYLERAAAKITATSGITSYYIQGNSYATFAAADLTFALDNYNTSAYACRHMPTASYVRMIDASPLLNGKYRTYWAEDINYTNKTTSLTYHNNASEVNWKTMGSNDYCPENTFDASHMQDDYTTSVLVRLQLNAGGDFYTTSVTGKDVIFQPPSTTLSEEGTSASSSFSRNESLPMLSSQSTRSAVVSYDGTNTATIDDYLRTWLWQTNSDLRNWVNTYAAGEPRHVSIAVTTPAGGGMATATVTQTAQASGTMGATAFAALSLDNYVHDNITLNFYDDGYCYYRVPIRHFDDIQTPWTSTATMQNNNTAWVYGDGTNCNENSYLGRYGVVRNNWYNISITSVAHVGSPVIPPLTSNADDRVEQLLNAMLNIASWTTNTGDL